MSEDLNELVRKYNSLFEAYMKLRNVLQQAPYTALAQLGFQLQQAGFDAPNFEKLEVVKSAEVQREETSQGVE